MAATAVICDSYTQEILSGVHTSVDVYKIALYTSSATIGASTTAYSATNEVTGTGYTAGGAVLSGFATSIMNGVAILDFSDPSWVAATITASKAMIYNSSKSNKSVYVLDFGTPVTSTNGTYTVIIPEPTDTTGLIKLA